MIAVVGAGLSGLVCAKSLEEAGAEYRLFEADQVPGGKLRSRRTAEGFVLDEGFQVLLDSYPAVRRHLDLAALEAEPLDSGALMWDAGEFFRLQSPLSHPQWLLAAIGTDAFSLFDKVKLATLVANVLHWSDEAILERCGSPRDRTTLNYLRSLGFSSAIVERFFRPFFGGVLLDNDLNTSCGLFRYYLKKFATGRAWMPKGGMAAIPEQLAGRIPADRIEYGARVEEVFHAAGRATGLRVNGEHLDTEMIVLATDPRTTARLLGFPEPDHLGTRVHYFRTATAFYSGAMLVLPAGKDRTARHFIDLTNVRADCAPEGSRLVSATVVGAALKRAATETEEACRREIEELFPVLQGMLEPLETIEVAEAVPVQPPGFAAEVPVTPYAGLRIAGSQKMHASIQGAMQAGEEAAEAALAAVASQPR